MAYSSFLPNNAVVAQRYTRVYRLALMTVGDTTRAADLTVQAFTSLHGSMSDPDLDLARALLTALEQQPQRVRPTWRPASADVERAGVAPSVASKFLATLWSASPQARLLLGLHTLWGLTVHEAAEALGLPVDVLLDVRTALAVAGGSILAADGAEVAAIARLLAGALIPEEAATVRGRLLADADARSIRDALMQAEQTTRQVLPALFAVSPPDTLLDRIEEAMARPAVLSQQVTTQPRSGFSPQSKLTIGVALVIVALLLAPLAWQRSNSAPQGSTARTQRDPAAAIEAAIHRFDQPAQTGGVLHEVHRGTLNGETWRQERWYEFGEPNRLRVTISNEGDETPLYALAVRDNGTVEYRQRPPQGRGGSLRGVTVTLSPEALQTAKPILRQQPDATFFGTGNPPDLGRFYLAQARTAKLESLGTAMVLGRSATLLSYTTDSIFPSNGGQNSASQPGQVVLTLDDATNSLLDVMVLPYGQAESNGVHPWRAEVFEVTESAPDLAWMVPAANSRQRAALPNVREPFFFNQGVISLDSALQNTREQMYVPQYLPEPTMRGIVLDRNGSDAASQPLLVYEGEFRSVVVTPNEDQFDPPALDETASQIGPFSYHLESLAVGSTSPISVALVSSLDRRQGLTRVYLLDQFATPQERAATLERIVGSLQPLSQENISLLGRPFYRPDIAGGTGGRATR